MTMRLSVPSWPCVQMIVGIPAFAGMFLFLCLINVCAWEGFFCKLCFEEDERLCTGCCCCGDADADAKAEVVDIEYTHVDEVP